MCFGVPPTCYVCRSFRIAVCYGLAAGKLASWVVGGFDFLCRNSTLEDIGCMYAARLGSYIQAARAIFKYGAI
jgi:hypothetical protein